MKIVLTLSSCKTLYRMFTTRVLIQTARLRREAAVVSCKLVTSPTCARSNGTTIRTLVSKPSSTFPPYDIFIIGSGAAGLVAAIRAHHHGLKPLVIEKSPYIGGASAYSGGGVWIPNNYLSAAAGVPDSIPNALKYLETVVKDVGPCSSRERKMAFLTNGPEMIFWLARMGFEWRVMTGYPDCYTDVAGGAVGRSLEGEVFDLKRLGGWENLILARKGPDVAVYANEFAQLALFRSTWRSLSTSVKAIVGRTIGRRLLGQRPMTTGKNLVA